MVAIIFFIYAAVHAGSFILSWNPACTAAWNLNAMKLELECHHCWDEYYNCWCLCVSDSSMMLI